MPTQTESAVRSYYLSNGIILGRRLEGLDFIMKHENSYLEVKSNIFTVNQEKEMAELFARSKGVILCVTQISNRNLKSLKMFIFKLIAVTPTLDLETREELHAPEA